MAIAEELLGEYGTLADWRTKILGRDPAPPDSEALDDALALWEVGATDIVATAENVGVPQIPTWFVGLTHMLAAVCDMGPGTIDPTPLTRFCLRAERDATAGELRDLCLDCRGVIIRMISLAPSPSKRPGGATIIPVEHRSPVTPLNKAAKLLWSLNEDSGVRWLKGCIADGTIRAEIVTRQGYFFDMSQFPPNSWPGFNSR